MKAIYKTKVLYRVKVLLIAVLYKEPLILNYVIYLAA